ncbi:MAG: hypothetical protein KDD32_00235 [Bacteroidetes bacterium]|nr:hypothetical protein [Bacteroidota bacterium]
MNKKTSLKVNIISFEGDHLDQMGWLKQLPEQQTNAWEEFNFTFNKPMSGDAIQVIIEGANKIRGNSTPKNGLVYVTMEIDPQKKPEASFLSQFDYVITSRTDIELKGKKHPSIIPTYYVNGWHLQNNYDTLKSTTFEKSKTISVISSDRVKKEGHKLRFAFVNQLIGHFKDRLDVFGIGFNPIPNKNEGLLPYKYSIAIENEQAKGYFTEKLTDCYLANCVPIYHGAPNIDDFFDPNSFIKIDINNPEKAIATIETLLAEDPYEKMIDAVIMSKHKILDEYQFFPWITTLLRANVHPNFKQSVTRTLKPQSHYLEKKLFRDQLYLARQYMIKRIKKAN